MGISVIRAIDTGSLAHVLADRFAGIGSDPFDGEIVVVPTRGIERYVTQTIADRAGICANIDFPSPREFLERVTGGDDPWQPDRAVWPLLATIDATLTEPWAQPLAGHLRDEPGWRRSDRRFAVARRLAGLFDAYAMERPAMVRRWDAGDPMDVPDDLRWQYELWRALRLTVGRGPLDRAPDPAGLPGRIAVFGPTRLPERFLAALRALARDREVEVYLPVASPALWDAPGWSAAKTRDEDTSRALAVHPLLRSLGRDARELRQRLGARGTTVGPRTAAGGTLLRRLQAQIAANADSTLEATVGDASLQVHACHGPLRQVEVLREVLLALLHDDPTLQPRDILIMVPDLNTYAPLLAAVFSDPDPRIGDLRLSIADRTPEQHNEVLLALGALLTLLNGRMRRSEVLDLLKLGPVRSGFDLSGEDVLRLEELAEAANVRWGLDASHRGGIGSGDIDLGTWSWGLDRMALGAAMTDQPLAVLGDTLPLPDLGSGDIGPVGRLAVLAQRIAALQEQARQPRSVAAWNDLLQQAITDFTRVGHADAWQETRARSAIEAFLEQSGEHAGTVPLSLTDVRHMLASVMAGRPTRAGFRLGGVTACQLEPMRSVPFRVIALLGMDDGSFPRPSGRDGDDILLRCPHIGERDPRSEDRQLLLDAIMAAQQHLVITYTGRDERTNQTRQPAVPVAELIDLLPADPPGVRTHPLQPFDPRHFDPAAPFSHDGAALAGARASVEPRAGHRFLAAPLPAPDRLPEPSLDSLAKFLKLPAATFFEQRLGVRAPREDEEIDELVPIGLSPLHQYHVGEALLRAALRGEDRDKAARAVQRQGMLPPAAMGEHELREIAPDVDRVLIRYETATGGLSRTTVHAAVDFGEGILREFRVPDVHGARIVRATFAKVKAKQALGILPELLALAAARPDQRWSAHVEAKGGCVELAAPAGPAAHRTLLDLFHLAGSALAEPCPITADTGLAYAAARATGDRERAEQAAAAAWATDRERSSFAMAHLFGTDPPFQALLADPPRPDERIGDERTRFGCLAVRIYGPLVALDPAFGIRGWPKGAAR